MSLFVGVFAGLVFGLASLQIATGEVEPVHVMVSLAALAVGLLASELFEKLCR